MPLGNILASLSDGLLRTKKPLHANEGQKARSAVLIGHSHSKAIFDAAELQNELALSGFNYWTAPRPFINAARNAFHPQIARALAHDTIFSAVGGGVHHIIGMVQHPEPFDFVLPDHADIPLAAGARLVPLAAIRDTVSAELTLSHEIIGLVRAAAPERVFHFEPPPPLEDGERLLGDVPWDFFPKLTRMVSPAALRWKFWRVASELTRAYCTANDIVFVECPRAAIDTRGFLRPDLYLDAMHVDIAYGALVVEQMKELL